MDKIISAAQTRAADQYTIKHEPISSLDLMERASRAFVNCLEGRLTDKPLIHVVCGPGNNGGDGFAIARMLFEAGYQVQCSLIVFAASLSPDCQANYDRLQGLMEVKQVKRKEDLKLNEGLVVDALFGSGLNRPVSGLPGEIIDQINTSGLPVVSVDIPSGLFADEVNLEGSIMQASLTISFQLPKLSFLIPEAGQYVGEWEAVDIGLNADFINRQEGDYYLIKQSSVEALMPQRPKFAHKGSFGRVQMVAGSKGKMGAAMLCGEACLKAGAGLLTIHVPAVGLNPIQAVLREAMATVDDCSDHVSLVPALDKVNVICAGPGLGTHEDTVKALTILIKAMKNPMLLDADALNIIASQPGLLKHVPEGSVLTPHVGEFERLFGKHADGLERIKKMREVAVTNRLVLVLKGAHSAIATPEGKIYFNTSGNSGMATAGSGDVLAGVITGLMAQGLSGKDAAIAGVFLHGMAGDLAKNKVGKMSLVASNLLSELPKAFNNVTVTSLF